MSHEIFDEQEDLVNEKNIYRVVKVLLNSQNLKDKGIIGAAAVRIRANLLYKRRRADEEFRQRCREACKRTAANPSVKTGKKIDVILNEDYDKTKNIQNVFLKMVLKNEA